MSHNYNTINGKPYIRISQLNIKYNSDDSNLINIEAFEKLAVALNDGSIFIGDGFNGSFSKTFTKENLLNDDFELINLSTGEATGQRMSYLNLHIAMSSFLRKIQLLPR